MASNSLAEIHPGVARGGCAGVCRRRGGGGGVLHHWAVAAPGRGRPVPPPRRAHGQAGRGPRRRHAPLTPSAGGLAAALAAAAADPNLGRLGGRITDAMTGQELWQMADDVPLLPASTNKVLTAAAALLTLDRQARISTRVVAGRPERAGAGRAGGRRRSDAVGGAGRRRHLVSGRGADQRPGRTDSSQRHDADRGAGGHLGVQRPDDGAGLGPGRHRQRRYRPDRVGDDRRRPYPADDRQLTTVEDPGAGRRSGAGQGPRPGSRGGDDRLGAVRRAATGRGAVGAADPAAVADDERLRQRDGRMHRPRGGGGDQPAAELRRRGRRGDQPAEHRARRHRRRRAGGFQRACRSTTG